MEAVTKRVKDTDEDRLSALPDSLIHRVLSFMSAREVVQTSVLSPRWRRLWASAPCINLDPSDFEDEGGDKFVVFVNNLLILRDAMPLDAFQLSARGFHFLYHDPEYFMPWIRYAVKHDPLILKIKIWRLPHLSFTCSRLRSLTLDSINIDVDLLKELNSGCPFLEDLELKNCILEPREISFFSVEPREISSRTLKNLCIDRCHYSKDLQVSIPSLVTLNFDGPLLGRTSLKNMSSLVKATIYFRCPPKYCGEHKLLDGLSNVTCLELLGEEAEALFERELLTCPTFINLKRLSLGEWCMRGNFLALVWFVEHSPILEKLTVQNSMTRLYKSWEITFPCKDFKMVDIKCSKDDKKVHELVMALIANVKTVDQIIIKLCL